MRLDFNVLWVDDQPNSVGPQIERIQQLMESQGFQFHARQCGTMDELSGVISDTVFTDDIDLILVDWDLGGGVQGESAIAAIREIVRYKDVVFYSAQTAPAKLRQYAYESELEGVYCASREELVDEVMGVFDSLVKKVLDLDHTRGIVMGATSDIDFMVNECLVLVHGKLDDAGKVEMLSEALARVQDKVDELTEKAKGLKGSTSLQDFFKEHMIFTANERLIILREALKAPAFAAHSGHRKSILDYQQNVVPKRNTLGHVARQLENGVFVLSDHKGRVFDIDMTRDLRRVILGLRADFRALRDALAAADGLAQ